MKLKAPYEYRKLSDKQKEEIVNQCGPNGPLNLIIPNHLMGLDISESCNIHDYMFMKSETKSDFAKADSTFLLNMKKQIKSKGNILTKALRTGLAYIYYGAVRAYSIIGLGRD